MLYIKWDEELRDYQSRGEVNVVEIVAGPTVELVDIANRVGEVNDTVTFRITATLNDYVRRSGGSHAVRKDNSTKPVEYWTLRKNDAGTAWIVASIEQAAEGGHHLTAAIETDGWDQKSVARDAVLDVAEKVSVVGDSDVLALTGISWSTDAEAAAGDLSVVDGRFDKAVLEVAVEQFLEEWAMNDGSLDFTSVRTANRTVMRRAAVASVEVRSLVSREPIVMRVVVEAEGVYYEVDRRTEEVLSATRTSGGRSPSRSTCGWTGPQLGGGPWSPPRRLRPGRGSGIVGPESGCVLARPVADRLPGGFFRAVTASDPEGRRGGKAAGRQECQSRKIVGAARASERQAVDERDLPAGVDRVERDAEPTPHVGRDPLREPDHRPGHHERVRGGRFAFHPPE